MSKEALADMTKRRDRAARELQELLWHSGDAKDALMLYKAFVYLNDKIFDMKMHMEVAENDAD